MRLDIISGTFKAIKNKNLWSRKSLFGYARKVLVLMVIILANVVDQILGMDGAITYAIVIFYIVNEGLSIIENLGVVGVLITPGLTDKLQHIDNIGDTLTERMGEELMVTGVDRELESGKDRKAK